MEIIRSYSFIAKKSKLIWFSIVFITVSLIYFAQNMENHEFAFWEYFNAQTDIYILTVIFVIIYMFNSQENERDLLNYRSVNRIYVYRFLTYVLIFFAITIYSLIIASLIGVFLWSDTLSNTVINGNNIMVESVNNFILGSITALQFVLIAYLIKTIIGNKLSVIFFIAFFIGGNYITNTGDGIIARYSLFTNFNLALFSNSEVDKINDLTLLSTFLKNIIYLSLMSLIGLKVFKWKVNGRKFSNLHIYRNMGG